MASLLVLFCSVYPLLGGRTIRVTSAQFAFLVDEPDGWIIDIRSAAQIANFVVHKQGTTWRYADIAVFGRFVPREDEQSLEDFVKDDELRFQQGCPTAEIKRMDLEVGEPRYHEFLVKSYLCPGFQAEAAAIAQVPGFFVLFSLVTKTGTEGIEQSKDVFKELIRTFRFLPRNNSTRPSNQREP